MLEPDVLLHEGCVALTIDLRIYRLKAIKKAAYRLAERFTAVVETPTTETVAVSLRFKPTVSEAYARESVRLYFEELMDQELREEIAEETGPLRSLILAHAFSNLDVVKRDD
ncbi:MAG TPA: His-Xaa-Ser system protein HxsD [Kofleriaceae bacterium]|jgi:His-Xaa-Ser system protein HxsD